jgi:hypothetical protein
VVFCADKKLKKSRRFTGTMSVKSDFQRPKLKNGKSPATPRYISGAVEGAVPCSVFG